MIPQMMIGKIKFLNFQFLFILIFLTLIITSFIFNNFIFLVVFILFFIISFLTTKFGLRLIKKFNFFQNIRDLGPSTHANKKNTPTIGGFFIVTPFLIFLLLLATYFSSFKIILLLFACFGFFIIGLLDDYLSIKNRHNTGLKGKEKFLLQSFFAFIFVFFAYLKNYINPTIMFSNEWGIETSLMIIPISFFTLVGLSNAVNLTDGLDGLASGCSSIVFFGLGTEILLKGKEELVIFSILCYSMTGLCMGFLKFNKYPAKIFMGDTGSLSIGAILGSIAILTNSFITLYVISGIFIIETLSVIIQVGVFKITKQLFDKGKRIFLMAPLHHHFELKGIKEETIVENFWKINTLLVILGIVLKINY